MTILKKQGIGTWISLATLVLAVIGLIIYGVALSAGNGLSIANGSQLFYEEGREDYAPMVAAVTACGVICILLLAGAIVAGQFRFEGTVGKVCDVAIGAARILVPVLLMLVLLNFLNGSFTGLGWTFFSNEELEIYPEAVSAGKQAITALVFFGIATVAGVVAAFFGLVKKEN